MHVLAANFSQECSIVHRKVIKVYLIWICSRTGKMQPLSKVICGVSSAFIGVFLIIFGISFKWFIFPPVLEGVIRANLELKEGTQGWDAWVKQIRLKVEWNHVKQENQNTNNKWQSHNKRHHEMTKWRYDRMTPQLQEWNAQLVGAQTAENDYELKLLAKTIN